MENLKLFRIKDSYINFLKGVDKKVQHNKDKRRPYVGVVLIVGRYKYFVPMESPKTNHSNVKSGKHIMKLDNGNLGMLGFNNMIPVHKDAVISFDINSEPDKKYAELLKRQATYINKHKASIYEHASKTYYSRVNGKNKFLNEICCDFKKLENVSKNYNPNYKKSK